MSVKSPSDVNNAPQARRPNRWISSYTKHSSRRRQSASSFDSSSFLLDDAFGKMETGLNHGALEQMLCRTIPEVTGNTSGLQFRGIATRCWENKHDSKEELLAVVDCLSDFLDDPSSQHLSAAILSDIHSFIGLIRHLNSEFRASQRAYVSAAWIAQHVVEKKQLAASLYRLGTSFGKTGNHHQMMSTLEKAYAVWVGEDED